MGMAGMAHSARIRSYTTVRTLIASAVVEGRTTSSSIKASVVTFTAEPFKGNLHEIVPWQVLNSMSDKELASMLAWSLRQRLREHARRLL